MLDRPTKPPLTIRLCQPRGFCAGVDRAIQIVVLALKKYGAPVYVRHEIVHNRYVVEGLQNLGAVFIEELSEIPDDHHSCPVVFSAHGVPKSVPADAQARNLFYLDATCPLVSKVHKQAMRHQRLGRHVLLIGHAGHPEVIGTMGQLPEGAVTLIENEADVERFEAVDPAVLGFVTQTTLSVEDTAGIIHALRRKFPLIQAAAAELICYATTNRQEAVKETAAGADLFLVVGAPNSSNSMRLVEVAERAGAKMSLLVQRASEIPGPHRQDRNARSVGRRLGARDHRRRDHRRLPRALRRHGGSRGDRHRDGKLPGHARFARRRTHQGRHGICKWCKGLILLNEYRAVLFVFKAFVKSFVI